MGKVLVIANQKGGVGKTTTAINLSAALAELNKKVLVIDLDPQGNTTSGFGVDKSSVDKTSYEMLIGEETIDNCIVRKVYKELCLIPANINLAAAENDLIDREMKEFALKNLLADIRNRYNFIIIDCPPSLNLLTINALCAGDSVIIPVQCEYYALEGLSQLLQTIQLVTERMNPALTIEGILFTMYDSRTNLSAQVVENVRSNLDVYIFKSMIPRNVRLAEAPSYGIPVTKYDPRSAGADSYINLAREVIKIEKRK